MSRTLLAVNVVEKILEIGKTSGLCWKIGRGWTVWRQFSQSLPSKFNRNAPYLVTFPTKLHTYLKFSFCSGKATLPLENKFEKQPQSSKTVYRLLVGLKEIWPNGSSLFSWFGGFPSFFPTSSWRIERVKFLTLNFVLNWIHVARLVPICHWMTVCSQVANSRPIDEIYCWHLDYTM